MDEAEFVEEQNFFIHRLLFIGFLAEQKFVYCVDCFGNPCFFKKAPKKEKAPRPSSKPAKSGSGFQVAARSEWGCSWRRVGVIVKLLQQSNGSL
ncbi:hypothetical protein C5167_026777 [Papaver somniferum]|nr:hypothetical protein C5167_026777 [Papaver somniferum]